MTFTRFKKLVKEKYPKATLFKHGEFAGNKINVAIIFNGKHGKTYQYNGTYCEVLNKLGIKAIYKHDFENAKNTLARYIKDNGTKSVFFNNICDYTKEIATWTEKVKDFETNYIIV